jgi:hypothetical protein
VTVYQDRIARWINDEATRVSEVSALAESMYFTLFIFGSLIIFVTCQSTLLHFS